MREVISLYRYAEFVISTDTGIYHISLSISMVKELFKLGVVM